MSRFRYGEGSPAGDRFRPACGQRLSSGKGDPEAGRPAEASPPRQERLLFSFGPFGVEICDGPYSVWRWHRRNSFMVELTDYRLRLVANTRFGFLTAPAFKYPWGLRLPLEIPYASMVSASLYRHPSPIALMEVLDIRYLEEGVMKEKSIAAYRNNIRRAYEIVRSHLPATGRDQ